VFKSFPELKLEADQKLIDFLKLELKLGVRTRAQLVKVALEQYRDQL
jgi:hypothetical protein